MRAGPRIFIATTILLLMQARLPARSQDVASVTGGQGHVASNTAYAASLAEALNLRHQLPADVPRSSSPPPSITGGEILTSILDVSKPNATIKLSVDISAPGQYKVCAFFLTSPAGTTYFVSGDIRPPGTTSGTVAAGTGDLLTGSDPPAPGVSTMSDELNGYLQPGTYTLTAAEIADYAGNTTSYDASQIATLFNGNTITIVNHNPPDYTPPKIVSADILTRKISRSGSLPTIAIRMTATDDYSGVASLEAIAFTGAPGGSVGPTATAAIPFTKGSLTTFMRIDPTLPTGTYVIEELYACDAAGNCTLDANPNDMQTIFNGKITFEVVN